MRQLPHIDMIMILLVDTRGEGGYKKTLLRVHESKRESR